MKQGRCCCVLAMKTNDTLQSARTVTGKSPDSQRRLLRHLTFAATVAAVLGFASLSNGAIVVNGDFELQDTGPADALAWTGENGTTILRTSTGGVGGSAGGL